MVSNLRHFIRSFSLGKRKKSQGVRPGEYGWWGITAMLFLTKNCETLKDLWAWALSWWKLRFWFCHFSGLLRRTFSYYMRVRVRVMQILLHQYTQGCRRHCCALIRYLYVIRTFTRMEWRKAWKHSEQPVFVSRYEFWIFNTRSMNVVILRSDICYEASWCPILTWAIPKCIN